MVLARHVWNNTCAPAISSGIPVSGISALRRELLHRVAGLFHIHHEAVEIGRVHPQQLRRHHNHGAVVRVHTACVQPSP